MAVLPQTPDSLAKYARTLEQRIERLERKSVAVEIDVAAGVGFTGLWTNLDANRKVRYSKDPLGIVHLMGIAANGAVPGGIFTLPVGYRIASLGQEWFATVAGSAFATVSIDPTTGVVRAEVGNNAWFSLAGITFRAA